MIHFLRYKIWYVLISLVVLVPGLFMLITEGLKPSIDFTGGTVIEIESSRVDHDAIHAAFDQRDIAIESIQTTDTTATIRTKTIDRQVWDSVKTQIASASADTLTGGGDATVSAQLEELRFETVGPVLGQELLRKTIVAALIAVVGIVLYIAWAFKSVLYGISALLALIHDVLVVSGLFAIFGVVWGVEVDVLFVTALLTTMSFSVHDTIVVFDRIRESLRRENYSFDVTVNTALAETMARSVNNSMTIIFMLLALVLLGGDTIRWFAVALLIGTISGTYSSPFVATPLLHTIKSWFDKRRK